MRVIGLSGKIGTGKSHTSKLLLERLGEGWTRRAFGDALKEEVSRVFGIQLKSCYEAKGNLVFTEGFKHHNPPKAVMTVREILQWWGTDVRRKEDPEYWVKEMHKYIETMQAWACKGIIVDDVRFPSECEALLSYDASLFRLRPYPGWEGDPATNDHESETALDERRTWTRVFDPEYGELAEVVDEIILMEGGDR